MIRGVATRRILLLVYMMLLLAACDKDDNYGIYGNKSITEDDIGQLLLLDDYVAVFKNDNAFAYNAYQFRSPFSAPFNMVEPDASGGVERKKYEPINNVQPDIERMPEPLESFSLSELGMVGTITNSDVIWALIEDGDGLIHKVTYGNYVGRDYGRIIAINHAGVDIVEVVAADLPGKWIERPQSITMK